MLELEREYARCSLRMRVLGSGLARPFSSVWLERRSYKAEVRSSILRTATTNLPVKMPFDSTGPLVITSKPAA